MPFHPPVDDGWVWRTRIKDYGAQLYATDTVADRRLINHWFALIVARSPDYMYGLEPDGHGIPPDA